MLVLDTNLKAGKATTQYTNFDFDSMVRFGDHILCASRAGLFRHTGETDNGSLITAYFEPLTMDFGISSTKRVRFVYLSFEASGNLTLTVTTNMGLSASYLIPVAAAGQHAARVAISRSLYGRYWTFSISNAGNGLDFSIDEIKVLPIIRSHGHHGN
jgi:hypothetical protein